MKSMTKFCICLLFISINASAFAANKKHDKQLLQAYNILVQQPARKAAARNRKVVVAKPKKVSHRSPQINATLVAKKQINKNIVGVERILTRVLTVVA